jgi:hypothetical protein
MSERKAFTDLACWLAGENLAQAIVDDWRDRLGAEPSAALHELAKERGQVHALWRTVQMQLGRLLSVPDLNANEICAVVDQLAELTTRNGEVEVRMASLFTDEASRARAS